MKNFYLVFLGCFLFLACNKNQDKNRHALAKFEPKEGTLVFIGQDLASIGGLKEYSNGYIDHFQKPAGVTLYTGIGGADVYFAGMDSTGLKGVFETVDAGNGPSNMSLVTDDPNFEYAALAIGLSLVNEEENVAAGILDHNIDKLGTYLLSLGKRPVFLRIGYEFDGHLWNHYDKESYLKAYKRIKDHLDNMGVTNTAYVWQSVGWVSTPYQLEEWYPGDEYVDWCGFSFFDRWREVEMIEFARKKNKPAFIAEASATISDYTAKFDGNTQETILSNPKHAQEAYEKWFAPFFNMIESNKDVIKAIHYIDCNWKERPMWFDNPTFKRIDARIETSPFITKKWKEKMASKHYINYSQDLWKRMGIVH